MCALFHDAETLNLAESLPHFSELRGKELAEKRADADVCKIIAAPPNRRSSAGIISVGRMIERLLHEPGEGLRAVVADCFLNELVKLGLQLGKRRTPNAERPMTRNAEAFFSEFDVRRSALSVRRLLCLDRAPAP